jgi:hypothetical protein
MQRHLEVSIPRTSLHRDQEWSADEEIWCGYSCCGMGLTGYACSKIPSDTRVPTYRRNILSFILADHTYYNPEDHNMKLTREITSVSPLVRSPEILNGFRLNMVFEMYTKCCQAYFILGWSSNSDLCQFCWRSSLRTGNISSLSFCWSTN